MGYINAAATLAQSLNEANSTRKLIVIITGNMSDQALEPLRVLGCIVVCITFLAPAPPFNKISQLPVRCERNLFRSLKKIVKQFSFASWEHAFSKLLIWTLDYEKVVWLDVDTIVLKCVYMFSSFSFMFHAFF